MSEERIPAIKLQNRRKEMRLSQEDLARFSGIPLGTIKKYECGIRNFDKASVAVHYRIAKVLNCQPGDLMSDERKKAESAIVYQNIIDCLVEVEMTEGCHSDYIEDYENPVDFYLSNIISGGGIDTGYLQYVMERFPHIDIDLAETLTENVVKEINRRC